MRKVKADLATVFKQIVASVPLQQGDIDKLRGRSWRWVGGVHVFPEAICPFCNGVMRSTCLWMISDRPQKVVQIVGFKDSRLVKLQIHHPHVGEGGGYICTGSAAGVAQAVFMGMNPADTIGDFGPLRTSRKWKTFFADYFSDHVHLEERRLRPKLNLTAPGKRVAAAASKARSQVRKRA